MYLLTRAVKVVDITLFWVTRIAPDGALEESLVEPRTSGIEQDIQTYEMQAYAYLDILCKDS